MNCHFTSWLLVLLLTARLTLLSTIDEVGDCGWDVLCKKKDAVLNPGHFDPSHNSSSRCFCDKECNKYGDCCEDIASFPKPKGIETFACVPLSLKQSVYAVSNCISGSEYKELCEKTAYFPPREYYQDIPVYSNVTKLHYANMYCAFCDPRVEKAWQTSELENIITMPKHSMKCSPNITSKMIDKIGIYQRGKLTWKVGDGFCAFTQVGELKHGRACTPSISTCPPGSDPNVSSRCEAYSLLLYISNKVYRNPHCALCNGVKQPNMFCKYRQNSVILPSLSEIFSFDWTFSSCNFPENMRWDNSHKRCMAVNCHVPSGNCKVVICHNSHCFRFQNTLSRVIDGYLTYICLSVSIVCLLIHVFISIFVTHPKNLPSKVVNSLAWSLLIAQTLFLSGIYSLVAIPHVICYCIAVTIQFFFLASFFWMNVISVDICNTFSDSSLKNYSSKSFTKYALYSWGGAALITIFSIIADLTDFLPDKYLPQYTSRWNVCWFGNWIGMGLFFYFPILITHIINTVLFVITVIKFRKMQCNSKKISKSGRKEYNRLWLYIKLSTIMGLMWAVGTLTSLSKRPDYHFPFTILNGLQGAFIFLMFDLKIQSIFNYMEQVLLKFLRMRTKYKKKALGFIERNEFSNKQNINVTIKQKF